MKSSDTVHHEYECRFFSSQGLSLSEDRTKLDPKKLNSAILPLRILVIKATRPDDWARLDRLMDHVEERKTQQPAKWTHVQENVVRFILDGLGLDKVFTDQEVNRAYGLVETNAIQSKTVTSSHNKIRYVLGQLFWAKWHRNSRKWQQQIRSVAYI